MDVFSSRNKLKPKPQMLQEGRQRPLPPVDELAVLAPVSAGAALSEMVTKASKESSSRRYARYFGSAPKHANMYEAAPPPARIDYPAPPLRPNASRVSRGLPAPLLVPIPLPMPMSETMMMDDVHPLSNDVVPPSSGFSGLGLKGRLPWRRNTTAAK